MSLPTAESNNVIKGGQDEGPEHENNSNDECTNNQDNVDRSGINTAVSKDTASTSKKKL